MADQKLRIGFIGIGNMGNPMAVNLIKAGWKLSAYDTDANKTKRFAESHGAATVSSLAELGKKSDVVITMLPDGHVVRRVVLGKESGEDCLVKGLAKGATIVDMSSSAPVGTRELGEDLRTHGISLIDAPVSGGVKGAIAGTMEVAEACNVPAELGHATLELWKKAEKAVGGSADHTEIARFVNEQS